MLRTIPPIQKLSVLVPETQAPALKGTKFFCLPEPGQSWLPLSGPRSSAYGAWSGGFLSLRKRLMLSQRSLSYNL